MSDGMKIKLSDEFYIEQQPYNYILCQAYISYGNGSNKTDTPRMVVKELGYFSTVESAIRRYIQTIQKNGTENFSGDLDDYITRINEITESAVRRIVRSV